MTDHKATKEDWKAKPPPEYLIQYELQLEYSQDEYDELMLGIVPEAMEDKWFIYSEDEWLYFHRSWSGVFIGKIRFRQEGIKFITDELWVIPSEPSQNIILTESELFEILIGSLLLGRNTSYYPQSLTDYHALMGRGRSRREKVEHGMEFSPFKIEKSEQNEKNDT